MNDQKKIIKLKRAKKLVTIPVKTGDMVNLMFIGPNQIEESMWAEITATKPLTGKLKNQPFKLSNLIMGEMFGFKESNILKVVSREEVNELIVKEKSSTSKQNQVQKTEKIIEQWLDYSSKKDEYLVIYKIKSADKKFFKKALTRAKSKNTNQDLSDEGRLNDANRMFLSLVFVISLPQIIKNVGKYLEVETIKTDKTYLSGLIKILETSKKQISDIQKDDPAILRDFKERMGGIFMESLKDGDIAKRLSSEVNVAIRLLRVLM